MMKNSKLSKLLVAGVSVAMLASALAPMAFAEGSTPDAIKPGNEHDFKIHIVGDATVGEFTGTSTTGENAYTVIYRDKVDGSFNESINPNDYYAIKDTIDYKRVVGWYVDNKTASGTDNEWDASDISIPTPVSLDTLFGMATDASSDPNLDKYITLVPKYETEDVYSVTVKGLSTNVAGLDLNASLKGETVSPSGEVTKKFLKTSTIALPTIVPADGYKMSGWTVKVDATDNYTATNLFTGTELDLGSLKGKLSVDQNVEIEAKVEAIKKIKVELTGITNGEVTVTGDSTTKKVTGVEGVDAANKALFTAQYGTTSDLGKTEKKVTDDAYSLPVLTTTTKGWTFAGWALVSDKAAADGTSTVKAGTNVGTTLDPSIFFGQDTPTSEGAGDIELKPVFVKGTVPAPVITYTPAAKTPNDKISKYADGKYTGETKSWAEFNNFQGGLFYNEADGTASYYQNKNSAGKFVVDTTVNGLVDGIVFDKGVQDTEAYGLAKVSDADPFFYLVSDGVYLADYQGIWVDEDGSIYNLINGCTSDVPFTGIVEKDGWATSVKDSKVDDKANGFILYGDTQYWFINGTCNLNETEAVREHTDGNFYYTVGAKIDFTFNGECNGHTFVNGVASK